MALLICAAGCSAYLYATSPTCHPEVPVAGHPQTVVWQTLFIITNYIFLVRLLEPLLLLLMSQQCTQCQVQEGCGSKPGLDPMPCIIPGPRIASSRPQPSGYCYAVVDCLQPSRLHGSCSTLGLADVKAVCSWTLSSTTSPVTRTGRASSATTCESSGTQLLAQMLWPKRYSWQPRSCHKPAPRCMCHTHHQQGWTRFPAATLMAASLCCSPIFNLAHCPAPCAVQLASHTGLIHPLEPSTLSPMA